MEIRENLKKVATSQAAIDALTSGKGNKFVGGSSAFTVGVTGKVTGFDFITAYVPADQSEAEWNGMTQEEREREGRKVEYFAVNTTVGNIAVSSLLQPHTNVKEWTKGEKPNEGVYEPKSRNIQLWLTTEFPTLVGKEITCVAEARVEPNGRQTFAVNHRLYMVK